MRSTLFRQQALDSHRAQHLGDVQLARPAALSLVTALSVFIALGVVLFSCFSEYTRRAHISGYLAPTRGLIKVYVRGMGQRKWRYPQNPQVGDCDYAHCVISGAKTDTNERPVQPNLVASQANKRLFRKARDA